MKRLLLLAVLLALVTMKINAQGIEVSISVPSWTTNPVTLPGVPTNVDFVVKVTKPQLKTSSGVVKIYAQDYRRDESLTLLFSDNVSSSDWIYNATTGKDEVTRSGIFYVYKSQTYSNSIDLGDSFGVVFARYEETGDVCYRSANFDIVSGATPALTGNITDQSGPTIFMGGGDPATTFTTTNIGGGNGFFFYQWQRSSDNSSYFDIPGAISRNFDPPMLNNAGNSIVGYYFRRAATSGAGTKNYAAAEIYAVNPSTLNNKINTTGAVFQWDVSGGINPLIITGLTPSGGTFYTYKWQASGLYAETFGDIPGATSISYDPPVITSTTRYRRVVISGATTSTSNVIEISVLKNNTISFPGNRTNIYYHDRGFVTPIISGTKIQGTDKAIMYTWWESSNGSSWHAVFGHNPTYYIPQEALQTTYYMREATVLNPDGSTAFTAQSNVVVANVADPISNNTLCCTQIILGLNVPAVITATEPTGGYPTLYKTWESSADNVNWSPAVGQVSNGGNSFQSPSGLVGYVYIRRKITDLRGGLNYSNSVLLDYRNTIPIGASITNPILTDATFGIDCLEVLRSQDSNAPGFTNQRGGPGKDVYFKVVGQANLGVNSSWSSVPSKVYIYDSNFNLLTPNYSPYEYFLFFSMGFRNGVYTNESVYYVMVEGTSADGMMNVQFGTYSYSDCPDIYMGFYWLEPGYGEGGEGERSASAISPVVYPNPTENQATIKLGKSLSKQPIKVQVYNKYNVLVKSFETNKEEITFSVEDLPKDIYYVKIEGDKKSETHRLVVK
jgi:hypothetical protein